MQASKATIFWPSISSYQVKDAYAHINQFSRVSVIRVFIKKTFCIKLCQVFWGWGVSCQGIFTPRGGGGASCPEKASHRGRGGCKLSRVGGKIPRGKIPWSIFTPGGWGAWESCPKAASPPGGRVGKLPRVQDKPVHWLKRHSLFKITRMGSIILKEIKYVYSLHYDGVHRNLLQPSHGTAPAAVVE